MRHIVKSAVGGLVAAAFVAAPLAIGAGTAGAASADHLGAAAAVAPASLVTTKILGTTAHFKPASISVGWSGSSEGTCTSSVAVALIKNKEAVSETLLYKGATFVTMTAHSSEDVCTWGSGSTTFVLKIQASGKKLHIHVS